jgi:DNA ligase-1
MKTMFRPSMGRQASQLALLLGAAFIPAAVPAASLPVPHVQTPPASLPPIMLAKYWQANLDPANFLVSEKLDGVRALWDGHALRFRSGRIIAAPAWFTAALPATPLDGELWLGRGSFDRLSGMVRRSVPVDADWHEVRYMIFDMPGETGAFSQRALRIAELLATAGVAWLLPVEHWRVSGRTALQEQLLQKVGDGAEGLVLHRADALWQAGRSDALRKLKPVPDDDARVVALLPGKGRHAGRMGALLLEMPNGKRFALGSGFSDAQRQAPPPPGSVVTYRYRDHTPGGLPRFASFLRLRQTE